MQEKQAIITLNYGYEINAWYKYMRKVFYPLFVIMHDVFK